MNGSPNNLVPYFVGVPSVMDAFKKPKVMETQLLVLLPSSSSTSHALKDVKVGAENSISPFTPPGSLMPCSPVNVK